MKFSLVGIDGNAFAIMGYTMKAMRECGFSKERISDYIKLAQSSNYDHLIDVSCDMIDKCNEVYR